VASAETPPQGSGDPKSTPEKPRPWPLIAALAALGISVAALAVAIAQTTIAREDASAARHTSTRIVEALARKVFVDADFESITISNVGTLPVRDVTVYKADDRGKPVVAYAYETSLPGCVAFRWEADVKFHVAVGFEDADGRHWLLSDLTGLRRETAVTFVPRDLRPWNLAVNPIRLCS
jgi:hypothetical protein